MMEIFCEKNLTTVAVTIFAKKLHHRCQTRVLNALLEFCGLQETFRVCQCNFLKKVLLKVTLQTKNSQDIVGSGVHFQQSCRQERFRHEFWPGDFQKILEKVFSGAPVTSSLVYRGKFQNTNQPLFPFTGFVRYNQIERNSDLVRNIS